MKIETLYTKEELQKRIVDIAAEIMIDFDSKEELIIISVLSGAFLFTADLVREIDIDKVNIQFIKVSSYEGQKQSSGKIKTLLDLSHDIEGKNVLIVEDIVDTGLTAQFLKEKLSLKKPKKLKFATLLHKPDSSKCCVDLDYIGFTIGNEFVVGYGLDFEGLYRQLPFIGMIKDE